MTAIDIGTAAINRNTAGAAGRTHINAANPANLGGVITSIEVWANTSLGGLRVGTFYLISGTIYRCRDSVTIGSVAAGSKKTFTVSIEVTAGDFLGYYCTSGQLEVTGGAGVSGHEFIGEAIDPGDEETYSTTALRTYSLYGTGLSGSAPTVVTDLITGIEDNLALSYGKVTDLGGLDLISYGSCWNKTGTPTIADSKTDLGAKASTGPFASELSVLDEDTLYYVRAYADNGAGVSYGEEVSFTTGGVHDYWYHLNIKNLNLPYEDLDKTKEIHMTLTNLSPTAKMAGVYGKVKIKIDYEPTA